MKIVVLNGSPKGALSGTLKFVEFLKIMRPELDISTFHIAQKIKGIVTVTERYREIVAAVQEADAVLFSFPLYYFLVHSGLKQFIETVFDRNDTQAFKGKYAAALSTSIHYFDNTAHEYVQGISEDMGMRFVESYSAGMNDFMNPVQRANFLHFAQRFTEAVRKKRTLPRLTNPVSFTPVSYQPGKAMPVVETQEKNILVIADDLDANKNLLNMIGQFRSNIRGDVMVIELKDIRFSGGCLGCIKCGWDNTCRYEGKDEYIDFYREKVMAADILVFAGTIRDRFLSWQWKRYMDRSFWRTHSPSFRGQQIAMILSGPLSRLKNIRDIFQGYFETGNANFLGFVTDESGDSSQIDHALAYLAEDMVTASAAEYKKPKTFPGVGGIKIFRDDIYTGLKAVFKADYTFYKKNKLFDVPTKKRFFRIMGTVVHFFLKIPLLQKKFFGMIPEAMVMQQNIILMKLREKNKKQTEARQFALQDAHS